MTEAKAQLSALVQRAIDGEPQRIVSGGRETVVVVEEAAYERAMLRGRTAVDIFSALKGFDLDLDRLRDTGRESPF